MINVLSTFVGNQSATLEGIALKSRVHMHLAPVRVAKEHKYITRGNRSYEVSRVATPTL